MVNLDGAESILESSSLGVAISVLAGQQNHSCYENSEQHYIDEYAAAGFRGPHEHDERESATSNLGPF